MLFMLAEHLREHMSSLNLVRYVSFRVVAAFINSILICLVVYPWFIRMLQQRKMGQVIREDGPKTHGKKAGTPTMGGMLIMLSILCSSLLWTDLGNPLIWVTLAVGTAFATVGYVDDARKLSRRNAKGLPGRTRLAIEFAVVLALLGLFIAYVGPALKYDLRLYIPFVSAEKFWLTLPFAAYLALGAFVVVGTGNAANITDGLDGLLAGPILTASGTLLVLTYITGASIGGLDLSAYLLIPKVVGAQELAIVCAATMGATIGFLYYNAYPAEVFMGDTGSLGLGGLLGTMVVLTKNELLSLIIFGVFFFEALSVILQTSYFKLTGRRIFPMSPVHHSFELMGWAEPKIVVRFWIASLLLSMVALASIKVR